MVGGDENTFEKYKEILFKMGSSVTRCGELGAGNTTKLANQIIVFPAPSSPHLVTDEPILKSISLYFSNVFSSPPTINATVPSMAFGSSPLVSPLFQVR